MGQKYNIASVIHEIVHRQVTINSAKADLLRSLADDFKVQSFQKQNQESETNQRATSFKLSGIKELLRLRLDEIEAGRIMTGINDEF